MMAEAVDSDYTAASIRVLSDDEIYEKFDWAKAGALAATYRVPVEFVERMCEAYDRAGAPLDHGICRYLIPGGQKEPAIPAVQAAMREILTELRDAREPMRGSGK